MTTYLLLLAFLVWVIAFGAVTFGGLVLVAAIAGWSRIAAGFAAVVWLCAVVAMMCSPYLLEPALVSARPTACRQLAKGESMTPVKILDTAAATVWCGDALAVLAELPAGSVDAVITDPPYSSGGLTSSDRRQGVHTKYVNSDSPSRALTAFSGDNRDQRSYGYWCSLWLAECVRIAKPGAAIAMFTDWRQLPITTDALQAGGVVWRGIIPWHKPNGRRIQGRFANNCEYVVWGTAGPRPLDLLGTTALGGFFQVTTPRTREHITQKPVQIMRELVKIAPQGGVVLDPFAGAGTTGVAALQEGRRFIGIEQVPHYAETTANRLRATIDTRGDANA